MLKDFGGELLDAALSAAEKIWVIGIAPLSARAMTKPILLEKVG